MKTAKFLLGAAAAAALSGTASAQLAAPGVVAPDPSAALNGVVPPPPDPVGIAPQPFLPNGPTVWSRLGIDPVQREFYRRQAARTPLGQLRAKIREPFSKLTGGIIPPFAPKTPSVPELKDPGPVGAAAKAKLDRAGAEERIKAIKYLATLDCHYWPEAEEALIGALRADRNECVRYEAAVALLNGCCCTCKVTVALSITVSCSEADGNPSERSARVRAVAAHALDRCLASACCAPELPPLLPPDPDKKLDGKGGPVEGGEKGKDDDKAPEKPTSKAKPGDAEYPKQYYAAAAKLPRVKVAAMGRRALELGAQFGYDFSTPINDSDYVAAGLPASTGVAGVAAEPTTLLELFAWSDSGAAIGKPVLAPPTVVVTRPSPVRTALATAPLAAPAKELAPAPSPARLPTAVAAAPATPDAAKSVTTAVPAKPAVAAPSSVAPIGMTAPRPTAPEPLKLPTVVVPEVTPVRPAPTPAPLKLAAPVAPSAPTPIVPAPVVARKPTAPAATVPTVPTVPAPTTQSPAPVVSIPPVPPVPTPPATQAPAPVVPIAPAATPSRYPQEPSPLGGGFQPRGR